MVHEASNCTDGKTRWSPFDSKTEVDSGLAPWHTYCPCVRRFITSLWKSTMKTKNSNHGKTRRPTTQSINGVRKGTGSPRTLNSKWSGNKVQIVRKDSNSLAIEERKMKTLTFCLILSKCQPLRNHTTTSTGTEGCCWWECTPICLLWEPGLRFVKNLEIRLSYGLLYKCWVLSRSSPSQHITETLVQQCYHRITHNTKVREPN